MRRLYRMCIVVILFGLGWEKLLTPEPLSLVLPENYSQEGLSGLYGSGRNLNHTETRMLYSSIVYNLKNDTDGAFAILAAADRAMLCSAIRWQIRLYARSRDGSYFVPWVTDVVLQLRDAYVHSFKYIIQSIVSDITDSVSGGVSFRRTLLVVKQMRVCFFSPVNSTGCPSYSFLRNVREKTDADIIASCATTDPSYNTHL
ncbi:uncharacterized protein TEOVI_000121000 [Trypanosoma equiperdum]|uniref:Uncharacterized protein n=4 Tax=Trypanozoon TaxID=39700 RepID=Q381G9_TRYB2|nr:hypothetical protein, conserved [Trypanosoma brucei gambiense DAL972]XP_829674.1 hypothetical protein, conserved [Trypanosoma brucei brucei TREU927]RHW68138.1 hypothetical protein DPX39_110137900 [Trypanosoma brucei equiperdum]SCU69644.1 hypothetical protein, conserved [Trypanosoma equiperdum]EAN80562.1 hypothetical protein, conserved [Trypanosoma brucei brucei TREU927]CBH18694.1 hypothetical protein, conserved [Trypanosoma brucei gambiense DAL972]|eukprot:XP_011780958.1 hypothetical protein, conserved [Trypanosoma brucei gambiense DAL972]